MWPPDRCLGEDHATPPPPPQQQSHPSILQSTPTTNPIITSNTTSTHQKSPQKYAFACLLRGIRALAFALFSRFVLLCLSFSLYIYLCFSVFVVSLSCLRFVYYASVVTRSLCVSPLCVAVLFGFRFGSFCSRCSFCCGPSFVASSHKPQSFPFAFSLSRHSRKTTTHHFNHPTPPS